MLVRELAAADQFILRPRDFDGKWIHDDMARMEANGEVLRVARGAYVLVPEAQRQPKPIWRPNIERVGLGLASVVYGDDNVALIGPSAARVHGAIPRALSLATVSYPSTRPRDIATVVGTVRTYRRTIEQMDVVRIDNDLVRGLVTSREMTMLDLASEAPKWPVDENTRREAIRLLSGRVDWALVDALAGTFRKKSARRRLDEFLEATRR